MLVGTVLLFGCGANGGGSTGEMPTTLELSSDVHVFRADLSGWTPDNGRWYSYQVSDTACDAGFGFPANSVSPASCLRWLTPGSGASGQWVVSDGPWWTDANHMQMPGGDGFGFVNVLAFTQLPAGFRSPANLDDTLLSFTARIDDHFSTLVTDSREGRRKGHIYLWFQTYARPVSPCTPDPAIGENCTRQSDYILTGGWDPAYEIDRIPPGEEHRFNFRLEASEPQNWTCLGRGVNVKYDCMGLEQALTNVAYVGFVVGPAAPCPTLTQPDGGQQCDSARMDAAPQDYLNLGRFEFRDYAIRKMRPRATLAHRIDFAETGKAGYTDGWDAPRYAPAVRFAAGSGLQVPVRADTDAFRLGLALATGTIALEDAGYQIYISSADSTPLQVGKHLVVMAPGASGKYDKAAVFWPIKDDDTVGFYFEDGHLLVLKNDEVVYQADSPCTAAADCVLYPFIARHGGNGAAPAVYSY
jgi:hypothetical protein